jgi:hypothetical protein
MIDSSVFSLATLTFSVYISPIEIPFIYLPLAVKKLFSD